jgi:hypothetical protein
MNSLNHVIACAVITLYLGGILLILVLVFMAALVLLHDLSKGVKKLRRQR